MGPTDITQQYNRLTNEAVGSSGNGANNGSFWQGQDGNVYVAGNQGTNSAGAWDPNSQSYWQNQGYNLINNPNPTPQVNGATNGSGGNVLSGGGGGGGTVDPLAQQKTSFLNQLPAALQNITQSGQEAFTGAHNQLQSSAQDLFNTISTGQKGIDTSRENNELNRLNGIHDILGYVRNGINSSNSRLANANALDSSAAGAFARAYGQAGNDKARSVGNQAFLQGRNIDTSQDALNLQKTTGLSKFQSARDDAVNTISSNVRSALATLDQQAQGLSLPGRIAVDQQKQQIIDAGMGQLQSVDSWLQGQVGGINPESSDAVQSTARQLQSAGTAGTNLFDVGNLNPGVQVAGPAIDQLPLFTRRKSE